MTGLTVRAEDLGVSYGADPALSGITLELEPNRIHGLLGRNGAGKTTLLSALASLRAPSAGRILIDGADPFEDERLMEQVCLIRESGDVLADEKLRTNLDWCELARPRFDREYAERLIEQFGLDLRKKPQALSRGQASAFGAIIGLAARAPVTMFDEVHLGMDAQARQMFYDELLAEFAERPRTIVLSSHLISEIEHLVETVTILHAGALLLSEESDDLHARGATLTGPAEVVDRFTSTQPVIGTRDLGPTRQATVFGSLDEAMLTRARAEGLQVGPVPLQDLFIHLSNHAHDTAKEST